MKKLAVLMIIAVVLAGCGNQSEQTDVEATGAGDAPEVLTIAWHKVEEDDGTICDLSAATQQSVVQASEELRQALAPNGVDIVVETLTPEKVEGAECLCNRVLIQGRFADEWLGAELARTSCSGCPNRGGCPKTAASGDQCGGQTAVVYQGKTYEILPANLVMMAGLIAAADMTGEPISYNRCPGQEVCKGECTCGRCENGCKSTAVCNVPCAAEAGTGAISCEGYGGSCKADCAPAATAEADGKDCPAASKCKGCKGAGN
jgi:hypothetical protein